MKNTDTDIKLILKIPLPYAASNINWNVISDSHA